MPFLSGLGEKIALSLAMKLVKSSAAKIKRTFSASDAQKALTASIASALKEALEAQQLGEIDHDHYAGLFERYFRREAVMDELVLVLDPRPGIEPDFAILSEELADEIDKDHIPHFAADAFLRTFISAFYAAAAHEASLQGVLGIKLQGFIAEESHRTANATEELVRLLQRFLADRNAAPALVEASRAATNLRPRRRAPCPGRSAAALRGTTRCGVRSARSPCSSSGSSSAPMSRLPNC
ncbi:MAG TPA: hypothetical protein VH988_21250, partial [Thermoanaerobaculia bacterium]|nr:hypothetical protein [Thermoanaerobaculia bacterium]